jgi:hypothetical protein
MKELNIKEHSLVPKPLYRILEFYNAEKGWFRKINRIIDAFEWSIKWHTVLTLSDLLRDIPDNMKCELSEKLATPSLGIWHKWHQQALDGLKDPVVDWKDWDTLVAAESKSKIISLRNTFAHGATPSEEECHKKCEQFLPVLLDLIRSPFFCEVGLVLPKPDGTQLSQGKGDTSCSFHLQESHAGAVLLDSPDKLLLDLWPLGCFQPDPDGKRGESFFYYYNALRKNKVEQLNYECCFHRRDKNLWDPFHERFPLKEWEMQLVKVHDESTRIIAELTACFKGRSSELSKLAEFMEKGNGTLWVKGGPGFGKSALLAKASKEALASDGQRMEAKTKVINHFIRRGSLSAKVRYFLKRLCDQLDNEYALKGLPNKGDLYDLKLAVEARLDAIEGNPRHSRLVLVLDGLDESEDIIEYIPAPRHWFCLICSGRPTKALNEFYENLNPRNRYDLDAGKLGEGDVRALLMEVVDKYDDRFTPDYVKAVADRSEGNPLYLNLLCDELFENAEKLGDIDALPDKIEKILKDSVQRITDNGKNEDAFDLLNLLAVAKASLSVPAISQFLGINSAKAQAAVDSCLELLVETGAHFKHLEYQLFHEKLRDWIRESHRPECEQMEESLSEKCFAWKSLKTTQAKTYALQFGAEHLYDRKDHEKLWDLLRDEEFRQCQVDELDDNQAPRDALSLGLDLFVERNGGEASDDARLSWLALRNSNFAQDSLFEIGSFLENLGKLEPGDPSRIETSLGKLENLGEKHLVESALLLLWNEMELKENWESREPYPFSDAIERIIEFVNDKIDYDTMESKWNHYRSKSYMHAFCKRLKHAFLETSMFGFLGVTQEDEDEWLRSDITARHAPSGFFLDPEELLDYAQHSLFGMLEDNPRIDEVLNFDPEDHDLEVELEKQQVALDEVIGMEADHNKRSAAIEILATAAAKIKNLDLLMKLLALLKENFVLHGQLPLLIPRFIAKNEDTSILIGEASFFENCEDPRALVLLCENLLKSGDEANAETTFSKLLKISQKDCDHADVMPIVSSLVLLRKYQWAADYLQGADDSFGYNARDLGNAWKFLHDKLFEENELQVASSVTKLSIVFKQESSDFERFKSLCHDFERVLSILDATQTAQFLEKLTNCALKLQGILASESTMGNRADIDRSVERILSLSNKLNEFPSFGKLLEVLCDIVGFWHVKFQALHANLVFKEISGNRNEILKALKDYQKLDGYDDVSSERCLNVSKLWASLARKSEGNERKEDLLKAKKNLLKAINWGFERMYNKPQRPDCTVPIRDIVHALTDLTYSNVLDESSAWKEHQESIESEDQGFFHKYDWKGEPYFFHGGTCLLHVLHQLSQESVSWQDKEGHFQVNVSMIMSFLAAAFADIDKEKSKGLFSKARESLADIGDVKQNGSLRKVEAIKAYLTYLISAGDIIEAEDEFQKFKEFLQKEDERFGQFEQDFKLQLASHRANRLGTDPCEELSGLINPLLKPAVESGEVSLQQLWIWKLDFVSLNIDTFLKYLERSADFSSITLSDNLPVDELQPHELAKLYLKCIKGSSALKSTEEGLSLTRKVINLCLEGKVPKDYLTEVLGELTDLLPRGKAFLPFLREILLADPPDEELSKKVVLAIFTSHLVMDNTEEQAAIANECPSIGMSFLASSRV